MIGFEPRRRVVSLGTVTSSAAVCASPSHRDGGSAEVSRIRAAGLAAGRPGHGQRLQSVIEAQT
jgi:hypothetical protein